MPGVAVMSLRFAGPFRGFDPRGTIQTITDPQGRYELHGFPKGSGNEVIAVPSDEQPYFMREAALTDEPGLAPMTVDLSLHKGVWLMGKVTDKATGEPVPAELVYTTYIENAHTRALPEFRRGNPASLDGYHGRYATRPDGTYRLVAAPGKAIVAAITERKGYRKGAGFEQIAIYKKPDAVFHVFQPAPMRDVAEVVREVDVPAGAESVTCDLQMDSGLTVHVSVTDADGKPARGTLRVRGLHAENYGGPADEPVVGAEFDVKAISPGERRSLYIRDDERRLGKAVELSAADVANGKLAVRLEPLAEFHGRLLNPAGDPLPNVQMETMATGWDGRTVGLVESGKDGRFSMAVPAGTMYRVVVFAGPYIGNTINNGLTPEAGDKVDLGDIRIKPQDMMRPPK
jgi:hypothetical protein